jgi:RNA polymerase sigma-70 factor (family 1)
MWDYKTLSDSELTSRLKDSDHAAFTEIYKRYYYLMFVHAYKKLRDEDQAKDIIQELFTTLWVKREFGLNTTNLAGYLYTSVRNRIFDLFAHQKVESNYIDSLRDYIDTNKSVSSDSLIREKDLRAYIEKEVQALPPKMRLIFEMSRKENLTHKEIADKLSISENNVSKQVNNALRVLKTKLGVIVYIYFLVKF